MSTRQGDYLAKKIEDRKEKMEKDYESSQGYLSSNFYSPSSLIKEIIIPAIEREVNEGKIFANLRQIYHAVILATWYKNNLRDSVLGQSYVDQNKTKGVDIKDKEANQKIYQQYLEAFQKGAYDLIKEDYDPDTQQIIPRQYFSGGVDFKKDVTTVKEANQAMLSSTLSQLKDRSAMVEHVRLDQQPTPTAHVSQAAQKLYWKVNVDESETQQTSYVIELVKRDDFINENKKLHRVHYDIFAAPSEKVKSSADLTQEDHKGHLIVTLSLDGQLIEDVWNIDLNNQDAEAMPWLQKFLAESVTARLRHSFVGDDDLAVVMSNAPDQMKLEDYDTDIKDTLSDIGNYRMFYDRFLYVLDKYGFEEPEVLSQAKLFNNQDDTVNIAIMGELSEDVLSFMQAASYERDANFFFTLPEMYHGIVIINDQKISEDLSSLGVRPRFMFKNGRPYIISSPENVGVNYFVDTGLDNEDKADIRKKGIPLPDHPDEEDYINEKDISMMILEDAGTVNAPKWRSIIVSYDVHPWVNARRAVSKNFVRLDQHDESLENKLAAELFDFLNQNNLEECVAKPNDGARGERVEFIDRSNYLDKAAVIAEHLAEGINFILQERITPPLVKISEDGETRDLDYNFRVFVSPMDGKATTFGKVVRIDRAGKAVNLSLSAKAWLTERLAQELKLTTDEYHQLNAAVDHEAEAAFEAINQAMRDDKLLEEGENATDFMGVDIIVRRVGERFVPYVIEVNDFHSGAMWDLDQALRETGEQYFSPEKVASQIGLANKGWIAEAIRRARKHKKELLNFYYLVIRLRYEFEAGFNHGEQMSLDTFKELLYAVYQSKRELSLDQQIELKKIFDYLLLRITGMKDKVDDAFYQKLTSTILSMKESGLETTGVFQAMDGIYSQKEFILFFVTSPEIWGSALIDGFFNYPALAQSLDLRAEMLLRGILADLPDPERVAVKSGIVEQLFGSGEKLKSVVQAYVASLGTADLAMSSSNKNKEMELVGQRKWFSDSNFMAGVDEDFINLRAKAGIRKPQNALDKGMLGVGVERKRVITPNKTAQIPTIDELVALQNLSSMAGPWTKLTSVVDKNIANVGFILDNPFLSDPEYWTEENRDRTLATLKEYREKNVDYLQTLQTYLPEIFKYAGWILDNKKYRDKKIIVLGRGADLIYEALLALTHTQERYNQRQGDIYLYDLPNALLVRQPERIEAYKEYFKQQLRDRGVNDAFDNVVFIQKATVYGNTEELLISMIGTDFNMSSGYSWLSRQAYDGTKNEGWAGWLDYYYESGREYEFDMNTPSLTRLVKNDRFQHWINREMLYAETLSMVQSRETETSGADQAALGEIPENIRVLGERLRVPVEDYRAYRQAGLAPHVAFLKAYAGKFLIKKAEEVYRINADMIPDDLPSESVTLLGRSLQGDEDSNRFPQLEKFVTQIIEAGMPWRLSKIEVIKIAINDVGLVPLHEIGHLIFLSHPEMWQDFLVFLKPTIQQHFNELSHWFGGRLNDPSFTGPLGVAAKDLNTFLLYADREVAAALIVNLSDIFAFALTKYVSDSILTREKESFLIDEAMKFVERRGFLVEGDGDAASLADEISSSVEDTKGGIDLNPAGMDLQTGGDAFKYNLPRGKGGAGMSVPNVNIQGLYPVIINIMPIADYLPTIGIRETFPSNQNLVFRSSAK